VLLFNEALLGALLVLFDHLGGWTDPQPTLCFCACILEYPVAVAALALTASGFLIATDVCVGSKALSDDRDGTWTGLGNGHRMTGSLASLGDTIFLPTHCGTRGARLLIEQSHSAALEGLTDRRSVRFHLCFCGCPDRLAKARALAMDAVALTAQIALGTMNVMCDPCLAADGASTGCRNFLDAAGTCVRRSVICHPAFGPCNFSKGKYRA